MRPRPSGLLLGSLLFFCALSHCSGSGGGRLNSSPASLVSTCDQICANVVAQCSGSPSLEATCVGTCGDLNLVQLGCVDPFASYLACVAGATSVHCAAGGQDVLITTPQCESEMQAVLHCNAPPGIVTACVQLPGNTSCGVMAPGATGPVFCIGAPAACTSPSPNPIGIGTYCCP
jgi:hypothetical protein